MSDRPSKTSSQADIRGSDGDVSAQPDARLLRQIMSDVGELIAQHDWETTPRRRMVFLLEEAIELAEEVLLFPASGPPDPALQQRLGREIYDVLWNACDLARLTGVDVVQAAVDKRQVNATRVWPESRIAPSEPDRPEA
jgi:NTP pyrophosphatase (non-canonical NTP hydrolase)